jgi:hypothetical protein
MTGFAVQIMRARSRSWRLRIKIGSDKDLTEVMRVAECDSGE